jgi:hypothetical protein
VVIKERCLVSKEVAVFTLLTRPCNEEGSIRVTEESVVSRASEDGLRAIRALPSRSDGGIVAEIDEIILHIITIIKFKNIIT